MDTYLVTGGAGFIGSNIVLELLQRGERVQVLDNFATGQRRNLQAVLDEIELFEADITDLESIRPAFEGVDYVLHQAALPSVPRSIDDPVTTNLTNVNGTLNVLVAARDAGVKRLVFASSSSIYGRNPELPKREDMRPIPISPYAVSKLAGETYCASFSSVYNLETIALRYFNVFGPQQDPKSQYAAVIPIFVTKMLKGESPVIFGDGEQSRDFSFVANVVHANILAAKSPNGTGRVCNIACGERFTLNQLVGFLNELMGTNITPEYHRDRIGEVKHSLADISLAKELTGYEPQVPFVEGLKQALQWYKAHL